MYVQYLCCCCAFWYAVLVTYPVESKWLVLELESLRKHWAKLFLNFLFSFFVRNWVIAKMVNSSFGTRGGTIGKYFQTLSKLIEQNNILFVLRHLNIVLWFQGSCKSTNAALQLSWLCRMFCTLHIVFLWVFSLSLEHNAVIYTPYECMHITSRILHIYILASTHTHTNTHSHTYIKR